VTYGPADLLGDTREFNRSTHEVEDSPPRPPTGRRVPLGIMYEDVVESETHPGTFYDLRLRGDGTWWCSCPGHAYRGECKHSKRRAEGMVVSWSRW
jgi:hypothetical protein